MTIEHAAHELKIVDAYSLYKTLLEKFIKDRREAIAEYEANLPQRGPHGFPMPPWPGDPPPSAPPVVEKYYNMPFIDTGGTATLNVLQDLDLPTLELLAAVNRANQVRLGKLRFQRQVNTGIAVVAAFAGILTRWVQERAQSLWAFLSRSMIGILVLSFGGACILFLLKAALEHFFYLRPRIERVEEFGHLLDFAVTRARILHQHGS